jgi:hypothetical protein
MARIIPNENCWVGFLAAGVSTDSAPTTTEIGNCVNLTPWLVSINASARGNVVATPSLDNKFETSTDGTLTATFEMDLYRDTTDTAWTTLPRATAGDIIIGRFGLTAYVAGSSGPPKPTSTNKVEVWPVKVTSRAAANLTNNTAQTFTVTCAVTAVPTENATVA